MNKTFIQRWLSLSLCVVLIAAVALTFTGCIDNLLGGETTTAPTETPAGEYTVKGEGDTVFYFNVVDKNGDTARFEIHTDAETVGEALVQLQLIDGEQGPYGLYIKSVLGQVLDYETDGMYWGFYVNGEYALTGVDLTPIVEGDAYLIKADAA